MSVSSHLADRSSPLRRFFEAELGNTRELVSDANLTLRGGQTAPPLPTVGNPGLVGTAADILLNAWLNPVEPPARMAQSPTMEGAGFIAESQFALMGRFKQAAPLKPDEWPPVARHGLLLAAFVSTFRSLYAQRLVREQLQGAEPSFEEYARRLWKPDDERDLLTLAPAVLEDHVFARAASRRVVNPVFSLSKRLGGADADLIADGTLWDYKSSGQTRIVRREDIWQLAAYLLADSDDEYQLNSVGISALRWRRRCAWATERFLGVLSGDPAGDVDLARWRRRFAAVVPAPP